MEILEQKYMNIFKRIKLNIRVHRFKTNILNNIVLKSHSEENERFIIIFLIRNYLGCYKFKRSELSPIETLWKS